MFLRVWDLTARACIVGSAGSAGARPHLDQTLDIIREFAREDGLAFRMAVVASDVPRGEIKQAIGVGRVRPMDTMPPLTEADVDAASHIVGQGRARRSSCASASRPHRSGRRK